MPTMCKCRCYAHTGGRNPSLGVLPSVVQTKTPLLELKCGYIYNAQRSCVTNCVMHPAEWSLFRHAKKFNK